MSSTPGRGARIQARVDPLRPAADAALVRMAEQLAGRPAAGLFGEVGYDLRDAAHDLAATIRRAGLDHDGDSRSPANARGGPHV